MVGFDEDEGVFVIEDVEVVEWVEEVLVVVVSVEVVFDIIREDEFVL